MAAAKAKYSRACRAIGQSISTQRYKIKKLPDEDRLTARIINLAAQYGRYGTPRITAMLRKEGFKVNCHFPPALYRLFHQHCTSPI